MAKYFMHLRDGTDELLDPDGQEFPDLETLKRYVMFTARDLIAGDVLNGVIHFRYRIDAEDQSGELVYSLPLKHAVSIIPAIVPAPVA